MQIGIVVFFGQIFPAEMVAAKRNEQKFAPAHLDNVINAKHGRRVKCGVVMIDELIRIAGQKNSLMLFRIVNEYGVISAGNVIVAENLNVHIISTPDEIFAGVNFIILALARTFNADNPSADGTNCIHQKSFDSLVVCCGNFFFFGRGSFKVAVRANRSVATRAEKVTVLTTN